MILKRFLAFFLSLSLIISSTSALAASPAGWTASVSDAVITGATATITAFKGSGASAVKSVIAHKPTAVAVGKELIKGGGLIALAYAASQLLGAGVDWVLDADNNRIKYNVVVDGEASGASWGWTGGYLGVSGKYFATAEAACRAHLIAINQEYHSTEGAACYYSYYGQVRHAATFRYVSNPSGGGSTTEERSIPINEVAAQIISNAEAGHAESQDFVKAVAVGQANAGDLDTALDAAAEPTTDTPEPDAPTDPAKPFDDSGILAALKKILTALGLLSILGTISDSLTSMFDWFKTEPESEDTEIDIDIPDIAAPNTDINFGGQCPAPFVFEGAIFGNPIKIQLLDTAMFCDFLATYVKWPVYAASTLFALYIYGGRKDE